MSYPIISLVGRPNVGKSTLFNRLSNSRQALVSDYEGLTRDRQYANIQLEEERPCTIVDTGGLTNEDSVIDSGIQNQVLSALDESDVIYFIVSNKDGVTALDLDISSQLRKLKKNIILVCNKAEGLNLSSASEFYELGLGEPTLISAEHNQGIQDLIEKTLPLIPEATDSEELDIDGIAVAVLGRPNVGKSTLINRILGEERVLSVDLPGTTRDSIFIPFEREGEQYTLIDTAGIRKKKKVDETIEKFSVVKALQAIDLADSVVVIIDASEGITDQDLSLIGLVINSGRAFCIALNKYDLLDEEQKEQLERQIKRRLKFASFIETVEISALKSMQLKKAINTAIESAKSSMQDVATSKISTLIERLTETKPPPYVQGRRIKLKYATQVNHQPPTFIIYGTQTGKLRDNYKRFLESQIRKAFNFKGTPIRLIFKDGDNPFAGKRNKLTHRQWKKRRRIIRMRKKKK